MTNKKILIINGPNLNLLGIRESHIYGKDNLETLEIRLKKYTKEKKISLAFFQSNSEGEIIDIIHKNLNKC